MILKQLHVSPLYGHRGAAAFYGILCRSFWWPNYHKDCIKYTQGCESCQRNKPSVQKPYGFLQPLATPESAFRHLILGFIGLFPICQIRDFIYCFILQVVDSLTKRLWIVVIERLLAEETAEAFVNNIFPFASLLDSLICDQGGSLIDKTWKDICCKLEINYKLSATYHLETNGQTERANKSWKYIWGVFLNYHENNWAQFSPIAEFCCKNHVNYYTGVTPCLALSVINLAWIFTQNPSFHLSVKCQNLFQECRN